MRRISNILKKELINILKDKIVVIAMLIIVGFTAYGLLDTTSGNEMALVNLRRTSLTVSLSSANMSAILGAAMFAIVTCFTVSRDRRKKSYSLIESSINPQQIFLIRVMAVLIYAIITVILVLVSSYLLQTLFLKESFTINVFLFSYSLVTFMAMVFSILLCSGVYIIVQSLDIVFLVFGFLFFMAMSSENYLFNWISYPYSIYSDFAGTQPISKFIVYSRLFQCSIFVAIFIFGILFERKYEFSALKSFSLNIKSVKITPIFMCIFIVATVIYTKEPYIEKFDYVAKRVMGGYKTNENITLVETKPKTLINCNNQRITCDISYNFIKKENEEYIDFIRNIGLNISNILVNGQDASYVLEGEGEVVRVVVPKGQKAEVRIKYEGKIKNPNPAGFAGYICKDSVYLLESSNWIFDPKTRIAKNMKIEGLVEAPKNLTVVTIGNIKNIEENNKNKLWRYTAESFELAVGVFAAEYKTTKFNVGKVDIEFYYSPKHEKYIQQAKIKERISEMVNYYEKTFGEYVFNKYPFKVAETSQYKSGGHATHNIVTVAEYMFNRENINFDASNLGSYGSYIYQHDMKIMAHEIAHQWWGNGVEITGSKSWLTEGLADYSAYLYMKNTFKGSELQLVSDWNSATNNPNRDYFKDENLKNKLPKEVQTKLGIMDVSTYSYNKIPLEFLRINDEGKCNIEKGLSKIYSKYKGNSLDYNEFLDGMGIKRGGIEID